MNKILMLLISGVVMLQAWTIQDDPYYKHKKSQFEVLSMNEKFTTMMLGDSITDEGLWDELLNNDTIQNRGISGDTTDGVLERLNPMGKNIEKVFIMIGVNDIMRGKSVDEIYSNYLRIIQVFKEKDIKILCSFFTNKKCRLNIDFYFFFFQYLNYFLIIRKNLINRLSSHNIIYTNHNKNFFYIFIKRIKSL